MLDRLKNLFEAGTAGIWIETKEPREAALSIRTLGYENDQYSFLEWDLAKGLNSNEQFTPLPPPGIFNAALAQRNSEKTVIVLLHNYHRFLNDILCVQSCQNGILEGKKNRVLFIILSPIIQIPIELQPYFIIVEDLPPNIDQRKTVINETLGRDSDHRVSDDILNASAGMTRYEIEQTTAISIVESKSLRSKKYWEDKAAALKKSGLATLYKGNESFENLRGIDGIRQRAKLVIRPDAPFAPKGFIFCGPPNTGKTTVAKAIAFDNKMPLIVADLGALKSKWVGESEGRIRQFIQLCEAMAPAVVLIDEIEDGFSGATQQESGDSGVSRDQLSSLLKWRSESKSRILLIGTCNEPQKLTQIKQGAFTRRGRFNGIVFFDLPNKETKEQLWNLYRDKCKIVSNEKNPNDLGFSPGDIENICEAAVTYEISLEEAAREAQPTSSEAIDKLRQWAHKRCLTSHGWGLYDMNYDPKDDNSSSNKMNVRRAINSDLKEDNIEGLQL